MEAFINRLTDVYELCDFCIYEDYCPKDVDPQGGEPPCANGYEDIFDFDKFDEGVKEMLKIERVIFNDPATVVFFDDGEKVVVKAHNEPFDEEKGIAMAIVRRLYTRGEFNRLIESSTKITTDTSGQEATQSIRQSMVKQLMRKTVEITMDEGQMKKMVDEALDQMMETITIEDSHGVVLGTLKDLAEQTKKEEQEEMEPRFNLKAEGMEECESYVNYMTDHQTYYFGGNEDFGETRATFTLEEIERMPEWLQGLERIPVND